MSELNEYRLNRIASRQGSTLRNYNDKMNGMQTINVDAKPLSRNCSQAGTPRSTRTPQASGLVMKDFKEFTRARTELGSQTCREPQAPRFSVVQVMPRSARLPGAGAGDGRVDPPGFPVIHQVPLRDLHGAPGNYSTMSARRLSSRDSLRTTFNGRAKEGFKYWYMERPKPTTFGRYGIGSYKTVLGLGSAPRT